MSSAELQGQAFGHLDPRWPTFQGPLGHLEPWGVPLRELANQGEYARRKRLCHNEMRRISLVGHLILSWPTRKLGRKVELPAPVVNVSAIVAKALRRSGLV